MELLMQTGVSENMAQCFQMLINEAMKMERTAYLQASPYERNKRCRLLGARPGTK